MPVARPAHVQSGREQLPIFSEEQRIMETVGSHSAVLLCGELRVWQTATRRAAAVGAAGALSARARRAGCACGTRRTGDQPPYAPR